MGGNGLAFGPLVFLPGVIMDSSSSHLVRLGLTNAYSEDLSHMAGTVPHHKGTFCSSGTCGHHTYRNGVLVHVGDRYLSACPKCGEKMLFFSPVSNVRASLFKQRQKPEGEPK